MMNLYFIGTILNYSALFITAAAGASISIKAGDFNLGGQGQIYTGGFVSAIILAFLSGAKFNSQGIILSDNALVSNCPGFIGIFLAFLAAALIGGLIALLSSLLKYYKNADFLLTSFIISSAICPLIDGLIAGPFRNQAGTLLATPFINQKYRLLNLIPRSSINIFIFIAISISILMWLFFDKTKTGKQIKIYGKAKEFSLYEGFSEKNISFTSGFISGALHGITGAAAVTGTYFTCHSGFSAGMGWNALSVALIAGANPLLIIPIGVILSIIMNTADRIALFNNFDFDISTLIQGIIIFIISIPLIQKKTRWSKI